MERSSVGKSLWSQACGSQGLMPRARPPSLSSQSDSEHAAHLLSAGRLQTPGWGRSGVAGDLVLSPKPPIRQLTPSPAGVKGRERDWTAFRKISLCRKQ